MNIQQMEKEDLQTVVSLIQEELGYPNTKLETLSKRFEIMDSHEDYESYVAKEDGKVLGYISLRYGLSFEMEEPFILVATLVVSKDVQGKGVGKQLLEEAQAYAVRKKAGSLLLYSSAHRLAAHAFYEGNGYIHKGKYFYKPLTK